MGIRRNENEIIIGVTCIAIVVLFVIMYLACKKKSWRKDKRRRQIGILPPILVLQQPNVQQPVQVPYVQQPNIQQQYVQQPYVTQPYVQNQIPVIYNSQMIQPQPNRPKEEYATPPSYNPSYQ